MRRWFFFLAFFVGFLVIQEAEVLGEAFMVNPIFPAASRPAEPPRFGEARVTKTPSGGSLYLLIDRYHPSAEAKGVVLYFHGNGELVEDLAYTLPHFRKGKFHTIFVEYPGFGHAPGAPSQASLYQTALEAYDWAIKEFPNLPVTTVGWSLGSSVAAYLASEKEVRYLLLLSAMTSMKEVVQHLFPSAPGFLLKGNEFDTTQFITKVKCPVVLIHGRKDDLVPFWMAEKLKELLGDRLTLVPIPNATHNDLYFRAAGEIDKYVSQPD